MTWRDGLGYSGRAWQTSPLVQAIVALPPSTQVYTDVVGAVYCAAGRLPQAIPMRVDPVSRQADPAYDQKLLALRDHLAGADAVVVLFTTADGADLYPPPPELASSLGLQLVQATSDGLLYAGQAVAARAQGGDGTAQAHGQP
jgi:hypothetical protein